MAKKTRIPLDELKKQKMLKTRSETEKKTTDRRARVAMELLGMNPDDETTHRTVTKEEAMKVRNIGLLGFAALKKAGLIKED